ncbi:tRNA (uridine(34)/cytosine(34)/5-carboxymethylaminomethyluridine(34)-2'-O)-methyltransferase TrmL [Francisellaceae bacterium]|nr:tRNA (uridine(34)/cytosine(34)/5-carboxymethylaminomethyluridine(34)-2'-O)-methyltransferase TrmL [Francisellaceae bacterium]
MLHVALYQPEIPPNTGNIIRLCANTGAALHLIKPYGFELDDKRLRRAGLDYHEFAAVQQYDSFEIFLEKNSTSQIYACSTHGKQSYTDVNYTEHDIFLFGPETRGLPKPYLENCALSQIIRIPMLKESRSLNLSNSVAIILYEGLRQLGFEGLV